MTNEMLLKTIRAQSWQRVLGELKAISATFWNDHHSYDEFQKACDKLIEAVEDTGLLE